MNRNNSDNILQNTWLKAAILGSIWAAIEIIIGSFLHNLKIPFAGTFLSMFSVFLLVAFMKHWNENGIILRAGIITALLKSISPSAVIFGPMIAIIMEALILEFSTRILGRNLIGYIIGGFLAVTWALLQKIINFLILFGFDLVKVADAFYNWVVIKTGLEQLAPISLIILIFSLYGLAGVLAAIVGYFSYKKPNAEMHHNYQIHTGKRSEIFDTNEFQKYGIINIFIVIASILGLLFLINSGPIWSYISCGIPFLIYIIIRYKTSLRYIRKPKVWIQFIILALIASLLWEWLTTGLYFSMAGLTVGLKMISRALIIIFGFSAISVEMRNPIIKNILHRNGLSQLYLSTNMAFAALPTVIDGLPKISNLIRDRKIILQILLTQSDNLLNYFDIRNKASENIIILTGATQSGKSTLLKKLIQKLEANNISIAGILAPGEMKDGQRDIIYLQNILTNEISQLASRKKNDHFLKFKDYYFDPQIIKHGNNIISSILESQIDLIILDEIGPMELNGKGWYPSLENLALRKDIVQLWVVREKLVKEICRNYAIPQKNVIVNSNTDLQSLTDSVNHLLDIKTKA